MKKLFYVLQLLLLLTGARPVWGQALNEGVVHLQSPQVWSFMKYTHLNSVDHYTGTLHLRVPLYTYKDNDFELPISVDYASGGYMTNVQTGILGLGWVLNAGGCITREVRGIADDKVDVSETTPERYGYLHYHMDQTGKPDWNYIIDYNFNHSLGNKDLFFFPDNGNGERRETLSDIYHFKFGEHRGSFMLGPNREVYIFNTTRPSGEYSIYMEEDQITIGTGDRYRYTFKLFSQQDYVYISDGDKYPSDYTLTWFLDHISGPNHRMVTFKYAMMGSFNFCKPYTYDKRRELREKDNFTLPDFSTPNDAKLVLSKQWARNLEKITVDDKLTIQFEYEEKQKELCTGMLYGQEKPIPLANMKRLKSISITGTDQDTLRNFQFNYYVNAPSEGNPMTFLRSLKINNQEEYGFSYYNESTPFPYHGAVNFDHWGYNNKDKNYNFKRNNLIPTLTVDTQFNERHISNYREPNAAGAMMGMLKRISYPTKGYTKFEYEGNSYSKKVGRNFTTNGNPALISNSESGFYYPDPMNYPAGGVRIKKVAHFDQNNSCCEVKEYAYVDDNNNSTGILLHCPRYLTGVTLENPKEYVSIYTKSSGNLFALALDRHHIGYSRVRETSGDGSYVDYYYTNYADMPDGMSTGVIRRLKLEHDEVVVRYPDYAENFYRAPVSNHRMRGLLSRKLVYNQHDSLRLKQSYTYRHVPKYAEGLEIMLGYVSAQQTPVGDVLKERELTTSYFNNGDSLQTTTTYGYNAQGQQTEERITDSHGGNRMKRTTFPQEIKNNPAYSYITSEVYWNMIKFADCIALPLFEAQYINSKLVAATRYGYATWRGNMKINTIYKSELQGLLDETAILPFDTKGADLEFSFDLFDTYGNVIQTTGRDGRVTSYVWGHRGQYMVAKIVGMSFEEVKRIVGESQFLGDALTSPTLTDTACEALRIVAQAYVTTYTYKPYVGMTSQTDPSGRKTFYVYDSKGRLIEIRDNQNEPIESYEYHFATDLHLVQ